MTEERSPAVGAGDGDPRERTAADVGRRNRILARLLFGFIGAVLTFMLYFYLSRGF